MDISLPTELAMVTDAVADFSIEDYIKAITTLVKELVYATKSFNNKYVFFFVSSEKSAKLLRTNHTKINVKGVELNLRPVVYSEIQFCDVSEEVCNKDIQIKLETLRIHLYSKIEDRNSKKIVYIHPSDNDKIRSTFSFIDERCLHFVGVERCTVCSICRRSEHNALNCPAAKADQITAESSNSNIGDRIQLAFQKSATDSNPNAPDKVIAGCSNNTETQPLTNPGTIISREHTNYNTASAPVPPVIANNPNAPDVIFAGSSNNKEPRPITKPSTETSREHTNYNNAPASINLTLNFPDMSAEGVAKSSNDKEPHSKTEVPGIISRTCPNYKTVLMPIKSIINNNKRYPLKFHAFVTFLTETYRRSKVLDIAHEHTRKINDLIFMLKDVSKIVDTETSRRLIRLYRNLANSKKKNSHKKDEILQRYNKKRSNIIVLNSIFQ